MRPLPPLEQCPQTSPYGNRRHSIQEIAARVAFTIACAIALALSAPHPNVALEAAERPVNIVALGDSLTAGYGLPANATFPVKLARALAADGHLAEIANAGVSGDTASDGLARLDWSVPEGTEAVIVELGANDGLRGIDPKVTRAALELILARLEQRHIAILIAGMRAPRNLGAEYPRAFDAIFPNLAAQFGAILYPFFLDGVAADPALNQPDGLHPTEAGVDIIVARILPKVEELIAKVRSHPPG